MDLQKPMNIAIIGAGNVAWHLAQALQAAGHNIIGVYSRTAGSRDALLEKLAHAKATTSLDLQHIAVDAVLIAVPDAALANVAAALKVAPGTLVAHTSGAMPLAALSPVTGAAIGVFYPLQTFSKAKAVSFQAVPLLLEAENPGTLKQLEELAASITQTVHKVDSVARKQLHLAAVFACNFTNHLLGISQELLYGAGLPPQSLDPLIKETVNKALEQHPFTVQTGPAIRHDENVIEAHLHMLEQQPRLHQLYTLLTQSIQGTQPDQ
ncbi:Rossmann-like and DUF2520 domain-containing protein [Pontibacter oryzae]|uniref:DUF2520 domain-containing protein n=1 Tax=Pontibacter oryzae TaxID=2304593 RepID=A0A399S523_9BACT|nr:Rossmann-like and DUF2520 domain-containing protein [Pontibacter oryzae]RIJ36655.1 DUF2520 domain-containing protein [Pontibacter oryzae]